MSIGLDRSDWAITALEKSDIRRHYQGVLYVDVFVERLWRSVKYEEVYMSAYESIADVRQSLEKYFEFYNQKRKHQTLKATSDQVYDEPIKLPAAA